jgi:acyl-CoA thioester hydrolase/thioesterase-3
MSDSSRFSRFETELSVRPDDIDMHQHVHNSRYLDYVLAARFDQMERCYGMSMEAFQQRGWTWFVRTAHIDHKRALALGDRMVVTTGVVEIAKRSVRVMFEIRRQRDERVSAEGWIDYLMVDRDSGRPLSIPEDVVAMYSI